MISDTPIQRMVHQILRHVSFSSFRPEHVLTQWFLFHLIIIAFVSRDLNRQKHRNDFGVFPFLMLTLITSASHRTSCPGLPWYIVLKVSLLRKATTDSAQYPKLSVIHVSLDQLKVESTRVAAKPGQKRSG